MGARVPFDDPDGRRPAGEHRITRKKSMAAHRVYEALVKAVEEGRLVEPFGRDDFRRACLGLGEGTYNAFLDKHSRGNPGRNSDLVERVAPGRFRLLRPLKYGY